MPKQSNRKSRTKFIKYRGASYRYFSTDPEGEGRGPGYYRYQYGQYFKREWRKAKEKGA